MADQILFCFLISLPTIGMLFLYRDLEKWKKWGQWQNRELRGFLRDDITVVSKESYEDLCECREYRWKHDKAYHK
tara:strand:- start:503 stop:727 length:225 start_codon:yes stop_codon:yes gene_type:complete